ncbi:MAG: nucleoside-diphosphate-sugar epimerase [Saprospiraceae bacterium]|jgi:nucleoside-diphosphate-sugar epimerase
MDKKKIIVTGASGFVGQNLVGYLEKLGFEVSALSLRNEEWKTEIDLSAFGIVHLAGLAHDLKNTNKEEDYFRVNTELTKELYQVYLKSSMKKFIYFSSVKAVADRLGETVLLEEHKADPQTPYGKSKRKSEVYILANQAPEKEVYIVRPCMIHGPGNKGNLNLLYKMISKGIPYPFAAFENLRSFLSIDNLNFGIGEFCTRNIQGGVYNFADDEPISTTELIDIIYQGIEKRNKKLRVSKKLIQIIAKFGDVIPIPFNSEKLKKLTESYIVSNSKIINAIGKKFPVSTQEGLLKTIKSFKK